MHDEIPLPASPSASSNSVSVSIEPRQLAKKLSPPRNSLLEKLTAPSVQNAPRLKKNSETVENEVDDNPPPLPPRKSTSIESPLPTPNTNDREVRKTRIDI